MCRCAFTLIEMLVVIALLGLAAAMVIPNMNSVHVLRVQAALRTVVSDITFAQADAIAFQQKRAIVFDIENNSYRVVAVPGDTIDATNNTLYQPSGPGGRFVVDFKTEQFAGARLTAANFNDPGVLIFDDLGSPVAGAGDDTPGRGGSIRIEGSGQSFSIRVEPFTGRITVRKLEAEVVESGGEAGGGGG